MFAGCLSSQVGFPFPYKSVDHMSGKNNNKLQRNVNACKSRSYLQSCCYGLSQRYDFKRRLIGNSLHGLRA